MASENETIAEIVREMNCSHEGMIAFEFQYYAARIEAAYQREILVERHLAEEYLAAKEREIAELRECLRESSNAMEIVVQWLGNYSKWQEELRILVAENRKALEGAKNEH